ncbi:hypothetical protein [Anaerosalibacter massiliensis]|uniref:Uncharacterized protein n=1 Tax=Anaerosalibacter massiliensis TaxID=1347392 RepID=A0A9X2S6T4_9FIRM|nr:hypothetical protein [Anaerosalibacter massiliensis]MCR2043997.1 hypothetical protein [Anaerosalibacter massiliensis]
MDYIKPRTVNKIFALADSMYEFELYDEIKNTESYSRYMICKSGHFEYDENLEKYIDFKRYGGEKNAHEIGAFSNKGYLSYRGYNEKLSNLLFENLSVVIPKSREVKTLKLYMTLRVTTYVVENDYGYYETADNPEELDSYEIVLIQ